LTSSVEGEEKSTSSSGIELGTHLSQLHVSSITGPEDWEGQYLLSFFFYVDHRKYKPTFLLLP